MKLSVFFDHIVQAREQSGKTLYELLPGVKAAGIDAVEINLTYIKEHPEVLELLEKNNLGISCIYEFYDMGHREESEKSRLHVDTAVLVGAERILVVPGFLSGEDSLTMQECMPKEKAIETFFEHHPEIQRMKEGLVYTASYGKEKGVTVTVEDFDDRNSPLAGMYGIQWFLKQIPELSYTLDTGNFLFYGEKLSDAFELLKSRIAHVHCKDRNPETWASVRTGSGCIPFEDMIRKLQQQNYEGYLAVEHFDIEEQEESIRQSAEFLLGLGLR